MASRQSALPSFRSLLAFWSAATHDRLSEAAASLGVTESAVSHQVRHLEDQLHVKLFDRSSGRLVLTEAGTRYLARIDPALKEIEAATLAIRPTEGRRAVRITLPTSMAVTWLLPRLGGFEAANADLDVQLVPTTRVIDLIRDQVDIAIRYGKGQWPDVEATYLFDDMASPVARPGLLPDEPTDIGAALAGVRLIVNRSIPDEWREWAQARGIDPPDLTDALMLDTVEQVLQVAEAGHGIGMGRTPYFEDRLARGVLVAPFGAAGPTGAAYYLCRPKTITPTQAVRRVMRWLQDQADTYRASGD
ncbi:MAG: LysR substrate-binding domain-containing protein [Pseudomonadota bacterium]